MPVRDAWHRFVRRTIEADPVMKGILDENPASYSSDLVALYRSSAGTD